MKRVVLLGAAFAMLAAACGGGAAGGSLSSDEQAISDAIYTQIVSDSTATNPFGDTEARCFADGVTSEMGAAELISIGLSVEAIESGTEPGDVPLTDEQADTMAQLMTDCVNFRDVFVEEFTGAGGVSDESAACLADGFDDDFVKALAKAELLGGGADPTDDPAQAAKFFELVTNCLSFEELTNLGG